MADQEALALSLRLEPSNEINSKKKEYICTNFVAASKVMLRFNDS